MSLGGGASEAEDAIVQKLVSNGLTVVAAAGNEKADACNSSPARADKAITVAATKRGTGNTDSPADRSYTNFGACVDIWAPGTNILGAWFEKKKS